MVLNNYRYLHIGIGDMDTLWATSFVTMYHFLQHFSWGVPVWDSRDAH
jgi:hypothetical protein